MGPRLILTGRRSNLMNPPCNLANGKRRRHLYRANAALAPANTDGYGTTIRCRVALDTVQHDTTQYVTTSNMRLMWHNTLPGTFKHEDGMALLYDTNMRLVWSYKILLITWAWWGTTWHYVRNIRLMWHYVTLTIKLVWHYVTLAWGRCGIIWH